jgi:hypothetical protein
MLGHFATTWTFYGVVTVICRCEIGFNHNQDGEPT